MATRLLIASLMLVRVAIASNGPSAVQPSAAQGVVLIQTRTAAGRTASKSRVAPPLRDDLSALESDFTDDADNGVDPEPDIEHDQSDMNSTWGNASINTTALPGNTAGNNASVVNISTQPAGKATDNAGEDFEDAAEPSKDDIAGSTRSPNSTAGGLNSSKVEDRIVGHETDSQSTAGMNQTRREGNASRGSTGDNRTRFVPDIARNGSIEDSAGPAVPENGSMPDSDVPTNSSFTDPAARIGQSNVTRETMPGRFNSTTPATDDGSLMSNMTKATKNPTPAGNESNNESSAEIRVTSREGNASHRRTGDNRTLFAPDVASNGTIENGASPAVAGNGSMPDSVDSSIREAIASNASDANVSSHNFPTVGNSTSVNQSNETRETMPGRFNTTPDSRGVGTNGSETGDTTTSATDDGLMPGMSNATLNATPAENESNNESSAETSDTSSEGNASHRRAGDNRTLFAPDVASNGTIEDGASPALARNGSMPDSANHSIREATASNANDANVSEHSFGNVSNRTSDVPTNERFEGPAPRIDQSNETQETIHGLLNSTAPDSWDIGTNSSAAGSNTTHSAADDGSLMPDTSNGTVNSTSPTGDHKANASASAQAPTCATRTDPRARSYVSSVSPPGTPCVFGVDDRDEGSHCIEEDGKYGSYGWCFTSNDSSSWGSCNEHCPLFGPAKVLAEKIEALERKLAAKGSAGMLQARAKAASVSRTAPKQSQ